MPLARLERALLAELDFESSASTNSTTGADFDAADGHLQNRAPVSEDLPGLQRLLQNQSVDQRPDRDCRCYEP